MGYVRHLVNGNPLLFFARHALNVVPVVRRGDRRWSEAAEDEVVASLIGDLHGWYADIGGQHPVKHSNTFRLYRRGWSGIIVEPNRHLCRMYSVVRRRDTVVCGGVGSVSQVAPFYEMSPQVVSTFSDEARDFYLARGDRLVRTSTRQLRPLNELFDEHAPTGSFGLLSVDVEGWDLAVLESNDWSRWRPRVVVAEQNTPEAAAGLLRFLEGEGYELACVVNGKNAIFRDRNS